MGLSAALGANLWILAVAVPLVLTRLPEGGSLPGGFLGVAVLVAIAPALLVSGLIRRSAALLLAGFPLAVVLPQALLSTPEAGRLMPPVPFVLAAASLVGFLGAACHFLARPAAVAADSPAPLAPPTRRPLAQPPTPARWRRRLRIYRALAACAVILPGALLGYGLLTPSVSATFADSFAGRVESAQALLAAGIGLLGIALFRAYLVAPLNAHLQHDRDLAAYADAARKQARRGRPRAAFYFAVAMALAAMAAVVWQRASAGGKP